MKLTSDQVKQKLEMDGYHSITFKWCVVSIKFVLIGHRGGPISDLSLSRSFSVTVPTNSVQERMVLIMTDLGNVESLWNSRLSGNLG